MACPWLSDRRRRPVATQQAQKGNREVWEAGDGIHTICAYYAKFQQFVGFCCFLVWFFFIGSISLESKHATACKGLQ